ncbi:hypothetical protein IE4872_PA00026 (plasmid) [Rhizobium gallicum]|uniref:Uncharacterized protein n=1 Tax=Rhizobium gallicum TaxID=56730 RepID=A0A1L5NPD9_9HYPH|nr:hypothetical protein [Rhizobium gallicum]APO69775.1 hypothetical protein IE4872_PA00026 [Rhizobium gallicum]
MSTIGELERRAGIGATPEARTEFWMRFHDLDGAECLRAGVAELTRLIAANEAKPAATKPVTTRSRLAKLPPLTADEERAPKPMPSGTADAGRASSTMSGWAARPMTTAAPCVA